MIIGVRVEATHIYNIPGRISRCVRYQSPFILSIGVLRPYRSVRRNPCLKEPEKKTVKTYLQEGSEFLVFVKMRQHAQRCIVVVDIVGIHFHKGHL